ncbi:hypothetical protein AAGW04_11825, partial [Pectobacterium aroidearum]
MVQSCPMNVCKDFISFNKNSCIEKADLDWDAASWGNNVYFGKHRLIKEKKSSSLMCRELRDLAKAMIYFECYPDINKSNKYLLVFKLMEVSFDLLKINPNILSFNFPVIEKIIQIAEGNYNNDNACKIERYLKLIVNSLIEKNILPSSMGSWECKLRYQNYEEPRHSLERRNSDSKLPDNRVLNLIGKVFSSDDISDRDVFITSVIALLMSAPTRISEVMNLTVDCEVFTNDPNGNTQYGIRYKCAKDFGYSIKWIPEPMRPIAQLAISRLKSMSKSARELACFVESGENDFYKKLDV